MVLIKFHYQINKGVLGLQISLNGQKTLCSKNYKDDLVIV